MLQNIVGILAVFGAVLIIFLIIILLRLRNRDNGYSQPSGPVMISGVHEGSVVDKVKSIKDRCLGAFR